MNPVGSGGGASVQQIIAMREAVLERSRLLGELQAGAASAPATPATPAGGFTEALGAGLSAVNAAQARSSALT